MPPSVARCQPQRSPTLSATLTPLTRTATTRHPSYNATDFYQCEDIQTYDGQDCSTLSQDDCCNYYALTDLGSNSSWAGYCDKTCGFCFANYYAGCYDDDDSYSYSYSYDSYSYRYTYSYSYNYSYNDSDSLNHSDSDGDGDGKLDVAWGRLIGISIASVVGVLSLCAGVALAVSVWAKRPRPATGSEKSDAFGNFVAPGEATTKKEVATLIHQTEMI